MRTTTEKVSIPQLYLTDLSALHSSGGAGGMTVEPSLPSPFSGKAKAAASNDLPIRLPAGGAGTLKTLGGK